MAHPTYGFRTLKGKGSRLLRDADDDWLNVQAREAVQPSATRAERVLRSTELVSALI